MYRQMLNHQGLKALVKTPDIPDYHLMIGHAEELSSQPIMIFENVMPKQMVKYLPQMGDMTYEEVQQNLASGKLTIDDFFTNTYPLGESLM